MTHSSGKTVDVAYIHFSTKKVVRLDLFFHPSNVVNYLLHHPVYILNDAVL